MKRLREEDGPNLVTLHKNLKCSSIQGSAACAAAAHSFATVR
jgi:hypothetical protein